MISNARCVAFAIACIYCFCFATPALSDDKAIAELANKVFGTAKQYDSPYLIEQKPAEHLPLLRSLAAVRKEIEEIKKTHADSLKMPKQGPFERLKFALRDADRWIPQYEKTAREYASPDSLQKDLNEIIRKAKQGVENKAPGYFKPGNDIDLITQRVSHRLAAMEALDADANVIKASREAVANTAKQVRALQVGMRDEILAQNEVPPDLYQKADREAVLKVITDRWTKDGTKADVLKVGIVTADWTRKVSWELVGKEIQKVDRSRIQGYVIVKLDDKTAVRYSVNLVKDHLAADAVSSWLLEDPKAEPELGSLLPRAKLK